jgi:hypothetical protein
MDVYPSIKTFSGWLVALNTKTLLLLFQNALWHPFNLEMCTVHGTWRHVTCRCIPLLDLCWEPWTEIWQGHCGLAGSWQGHRLRAHHISHWGFGEHGLAPFAWRKEALTWRCLFMKG